MKQDIYISEWLERDYKVVYDQLFKALADLQIRFKILPYSQEVWCRDYMPVYIGEGRFVGFHFRPDYLWDKPSDQKYITRQELAVEDLSINFSDKVDLFFDGGNYVRCGDKVVMTDKVFSENPNWRPVALLNRLEEAFQAEVILLPWDMEESFGHSDGMVTCLGNNRVLLNNFRQLEKGKGKDKPFTKRLIKILEYHFDIVELKYDCNPSHDSWCYLNYLETDDAIVLPALSEKHDCENDQAAFSVFQHIFNNKIIKQVYSYPLIKHGGALHCATWNHYY
jgi:agmatine/peptidylarginine deiminase